VEAIRTEGKRMSAHAKKIAHYQRTKALGRISAPDARDKQHHMSAVLPRRAIAITSKTWVPGQILDQGDRPACVGYSWTGFLLASPTRTKIANLTGGLSYPVELYSSAQKVDEWPGEDYDGTSVRAGAKVLANQNRLSEYVWAWDAETLKRFILARGPAVIGINWYETMFATNERGFLLVDGPLAGGHAILVLGYSKSRNAFRLLNSWGAGWGEHGRAWIRFADMERLIEEDGEACSAVEVIPVVAK
jgi:hypothetical protein